MGRSGQIAYLDFIPSAQVGPELRSFIAVRLSQLVTF